MLSPGVVAVGSDDQGPSNDEDTQSISWATQLLPIRAPDSVNPGVSLHTSQLLEERTPPQSVTKMRGEKEREKRKNEGKEKYKKENGILNSFINEFSRDPLLKGYKIYK